MVKTDAKSQDGLRRVQKIKHTLGRAADVAAVTAVASVSYNTCINFFSISFDLFLIDTRNECYAEWEK